MQFISYNLASADMQNGDDIDRIFSRLLPLEPPGELITQILNHVQNLPEPAPEEWLNLDVIREEEPLLIHNERSEPS